jgi:hypothetical protein
MKTRSTILSLAALATLSLSALAPTQASAWGMRDGYGYGYRSTGFLAPSIRHRIWGSEPCDPCPTERAPVIQRPRVTEEIPCEHEAFRPRGYAPERMPREYAPMRQAQGYGQGYGQDYGRGYGSAPQMHGYPPSQGQFRVSESPGRRDVSQMNRRDSYQENQEVEAPRQANAASAQTELQR